MSMMRPAPHLDDAIAERDGIVAIVRDVHRAEVQRIVQTHELGSHHRTQLGIEAGQRLVQQQDGRIADQRACQRRPLLLAARELMRVPQSKLLNPCEIQRLLNTRGSFSRRVAPGLQNELQLLSDGEMRPERQVLEHKSHATAIWRDDRATVLRRKAAVQQNSTAIRDVESCDRPEQRRLAGAARSKDDHEFAAGNVEGNVVQRHMGTESLGNVLDRNRRRRRHRVCPRVAAATNIASGTVMTLICNNASSATCDGGELAMSV